MVPGDSAFWDVGERSAAAASFCGDEALQRCPVGLPERPELIVLEWDAASLRLKGAPSGASVKPAGLFTDISLPPAGTRESGVGGDVLEALSQLPASSCHGIFSLDLKAPVEEAVLLWVAVYEVASMPLSVDVP